MRLISFLLALLFAAPVLAAPKAWVVRDTDTEITLFGTVHALPRGIDWLTPALVARVDGADTVVLEAVLPTDPAALQPVIARIGMPIGLKPIAQRVPASDVPRLTAAAVAVGVPMAALDRMESWLAAMTIGNAALASAGLSAETGAEAVLLARARSANKPVIGLETAEQQLGFFGGLPPADQTAMLLATIGEVGTAKADMDAVVALWMAGDVDAIARDFATEMQATPVLRQRLLTQRNARWADWLAGVMARPGKVFVAVGAGHLGGSDGLLAMLRAKGLAVAAAE